MRPKIAISMNDTDHDKQCWFFFVGGGPLVAHPFFRVSNIQYSSRETE